MQIIIVTTCEILHKDIEIPNLNRIPVLPWVVSYEIPVADPGFPVGGGVDLVRGAVDPRGGYVSKILHVKTKESGPVGGGARPPLDPPMHTVFPLTIVSNP